MMKKRQANSHHGPVTLHGRQIFILPTRAGLGFGLLITLLLIGAINYNNNLIYILTFTLSGLFFIAMLHTYRNLLGLQLTVQQTEHCFSGAQVAFHLQIQHPNNRILHSSIELNNPQSNSLITQVIANQPSHLIIYLPGTQRGQVTLGIITLSTQFPLGIFRAWSNIYFTINAYVYPKPAPLNTPYPYMSGGQSSGLTNTNGGDDFYGLRPHQASDSLHHIHWKIAARSGKLMTKIFSEDQSHILLLDWDHIAETNLEKKLSLLCRWILDAHQQAIPFGLNIPGHRIKPDSGINHRDQCLRALACYDTTSVNSRDMRGSS
ncbi:MAG: DUF58 domain-containing protein [Gammaproteobacteria bacterium]|nr:DUF58 domain-containing protein [Gammaproteobacteria bacterium]